ncbi:MAG: arginine repressor, partial [Planctomycetota bacterium]|nr:arginine repressor [Planctomycetota bacterium]
QVTQATISRDFRALGVIKGPMGYALPGTHALDSFPDEIGELESLLTRHASCIETADSLVVIKTAPGHANLLAVAFDRWPPKSVVGTIAGDDTIFVATNSRTAASKLTTELRRRAGMRSRPRRH